MTLVDEANEQNARLLTAALLAENIAVYSTTRANERADWLAACRAEQTRRETR